eukprot:TRINITY_DN10399_c0_g2_i1.p1 TRINITY_DN10399_c0_g2~~TRINITY_DN10399_c0_g2_i1.p1  ORF type:complete len:342 (+),score=89.22 TRINITY_DN10399_c0_g2_i1:629-1654(+)
MIEKYFGNISEKPPTGQTPSLRQKLLDRVSFYQKVIDTAFSKKDAALAALDTEGVVESPELRDSQRRLRKLGAINKTKVLTLLKKRRRGTFNPPNKQLFKRLLDGEITSSLERLQCEQWKTVEEHIQNVIFTCLDPKKTKIEGPCAQAAVWKPFLEAMKEKPTLDFITSFIFNPGSRGKRGEPLLTAEHRERFLFLWAAVESILSNHLAKTSTLVDPVATLEELVAYYEREIFSKPEHQNEVAFPKAESQFGLQVSGQGQVLKAFDGKKAEDSEERSTAVTELEKAESLETSQPQQVFHQAKSSPALQTSAPIRRKAQPVEIRPPVPVSYTHLTLPTIYSV